MKTSAHRNAQWWRCEGGKGTVDSTQQQWMHMQCIVHIECRHQQQKRQQKIKNNNQGNKRLLLNYKSHTEKCLREFIKYAHVYCVSCVGKRRSYSEKTFFMPCLKQWNASILYTLNVEYDNGIIVMRTYIVKLLQIHVFAVHWTAVQKEFERSKSAFIGKQWRIVIVNLRWSPQGHHHLGPPKRSGDLVFSLIERILWSSKSVLRTFYIVQKNKIEDSPHVWSYQDIQILNPLTLGRFSKAKSEQSPGNLRY